MSIEHVRFPAPWTEEGTLPVMADHFVDVSKTISMPKGAEKEIADLMLTRYAGYLMAQNGDPRSFWRQELQTGEDFRFYRFKINLTSFCY